jgi:hypothetical protein
MKRREGVRGVPGEPAARLAGINKSEVDVESLPGHGDALARDASLT